MFQHIILFIATTQGIDEGMMNTPHNLSLIINALKTCILYAKQNNRINRSIGFSTGKSSGERSLHFPVSEQHDKVCFLSYLDKRVEKNKACGGTTVCGCHSLMN